MSTGTGTGTAAAVNLNLNNPSAINVGGVGISQTPNATPGAKLAINTHGSGIAGKQLANSSSTSNIGGSAKKRS